MTAQFCGRMNTSSVEDVVDEKFRRDGNEGGKAGKPAR